MLKKSKQVWLLLRCHSSTAQLRFAHFIKSSTETKNSDAFDQLSTSADRGHLQPLEDQKSAYKNYLKKQPTSLPYNDYSNISGETRFRENYNQPLFKKNSFQSRSNLKPEFKKETTFRSRKNFNLKEDVINQHRVETPFISTANNVEKQFLIQKNNYNEHPNVAQRSKEEIDQWMSLNNITLTGNMVPRPILKFEEANFPEKLQNILEKYYQQPTIIQSVSWPVAISGRDLISIASTGSGKTLGFILPSIIHTLNQPNNLRRRNPVVLVLLPTRELAQQVQEVTKEFCSAIGLRQVCLYGGASRSVQERTLSHGVDICIATPGRLLDFMESRTLSMSQCSFVVLDEADRMLDMGFEPQIRRIISQIRPDRQTLMFSATWPKEVRLLANDFQDNPIFLNVGSTELSANHNITQIVEILNDYEKQDRLQEILEDSLNKTKKILVFVATKRQANELTSSLRQDGMHTLCIHGDKSQAERDWALNEFRSGKVPILLATDVVARGLDVNDITLVINYDYANNSEDYIHRIGRTGRQDKKGTAITFFTKDDKPKAADLIQVMEEANQTVPQELREMATTFTNKSEFSRFRSSSTKTRNVGFRSYKTNKNTFGKRDYNRNW